MGKIRKITYEQLCDIDKNDFFVLLEGVRNFLRLKQGIFNKELGLCNSTYCQTIKNKSFYTLSKPNLDKLIKLFSQQEGAEQAQSFFLILNGMRLTPLYEAKDMQELIEAVREYSGFTSKELSLQTGISLSAINSSSRMGTLFMDGKNPQLKSFLIEAYPELEPFIAALESQRAFKAFKQSQTQAQQQLQTSSPVLEAAATQNVTAFLSGNGISSQPDTMTLSM